MTNDEYEKLNEAEKQERSYGMLNCYICPRKHFTFTIDRDHGVTPFMIRCEHRESLALNSKKSLRSIQCSEAAESSFYRVPKEYEWLVTHEFYRPTFEYFKSRISRPEMINHIEHGGLCFRKIGDLDCYGADDVETPQFNYPTQKGS